jgi:hypothetical protein
MSSRWTHVVKTDDDCYVRADALMATLRLPPDKVLNKTGGNYRLSRVYTGATGCKQLYITESAVCTLFSCVSCCTLTLKFAH